MEDNTKVIESKKPIIAKPTAEEFAEAYKELCEKMGFQIVCNPAFIKRDDGSYSVVMQISIGEMSKS